MTQFTLTRSLTFDKKLSSEYSLIVSYSCRRGDVFAAGGCWCVGDGSRLRVTVKVSLLLLLLYHTISGRQELYAGTTLCQILAGLFAEFWAQQNAPYMYVVCRRRSNGVSCSGNADKRDVSARDLLMETATTTEVAVTSSHEPMSVVCKL